MTVPPDPGLCGHCVHARIVDTRRGSRFWRCALSDVDVRFARYPRLPVIACIGHTEGAPQNPAPDDSESRAE